MYGRRADDGKHAESVIGVDTRLLEPLRRGSVRGRGSGGVREGCGFTGLGGQKPSVFACFAKDGSQWSLSCLWGAFGVTLWCFRGHFAELWGLPGLPQWGRSLRGAGPTGQHL